MAINEELIEEYLQFLRGSGPEPDLSGLSVEVLSELEIVKLLADRRELPPIENDPVAKRLGLDFRRQDLTGS